MRRYSGLPSHSWFTMVSNDIRRDSGGSRTGQQDTAHNLELFENDPTIFAQIIRLIE